MSEPTTTYFSRRDQTYCLIPLRVFKQLLHGIRGKQPPKRWQNFIGVADVFLRKTPYMLYVSRESTPQREPHPLIILSRKYLAGKDYVELAGNANHLEDLLGYLYQSEHWKELLHAQ